ncbi:MAG: hypothetical protein AMXMBFR33_52870 [Candidatus Xenobia bacterium]
MRTVLVIDDEDDIREVAQVSLEALGGWNVLTASSGIQGIERAASDQPDAILLDVMMPGMDGPTTFQKLQAEEGTRAIPVIFLTAKVQAADRQRFADLGVAGVIAKPFDPMTLAGDIAALLKWPDGP